MKFFAGFLVGVVAVAATWAGATLLLQGEPCAGACQGELVCMEGLCVPAPGTATAAPDPATRKPKKGSGGAGALIAPDDALTVVGTVGLEERVVLDMEGKAPDPLEDAVIERRVASVTPKIIGCISGAASRVESIAAGNVEVSFRVKPDGDVGGVKITAAGSLVKAGVGRCITSVVKRLKFPPSMGTVVTYPFTHN